MNRFDPLYDLFPFDPSCSDGERQHRPWLDYWGGVNPDGSEHYLKHIADGGEWDEYYDELDLRFNKQERSKP